MYTLQFINNIYIQQLLLPKLRTRLVRFCNSCFIFVRSVSSVLLNRASFLLISALRVSIVVINSSFSVYVVYSIKVHR